MRKLVVLFCVLLAIFISSCRKDFSTIPSFGELEFSRDTLFLDTIFTNIGSATYNFKVYNRSSDDITIPNIALERGTGSNYRLNVDGIPGKDFQNIDILANDSIFIFVETTVDVSSLADPLYTDRVLFDTGTNQQDVDLVTLVQDANFIFPGRNPITLEVDQLTLDGNPTEIQGRFLSDSELNFTSDKPYVIYGYAAVAANKILTIDAGAEIYFHENSGIIVDRDGSVKVNGTLADKVIFQGDRLENSFSNTPGQWGTIFLRAGSKENEFNHAIIKNGAIGIWTDSITSSTPTLTIRNTEVFNNSLYNILATESSILAENTVLGNAGQASFGALGGGAYDFTHSTFANFWPGAILEPAVFLTNFFSATDNQGNNIRIVRNLSRANFVNCIIEANAIGFHPIREDGGDFNFNVANSMIQFEDNSGSFDNIPEVDFTNASFYQSIILNGFPNFRNRSQNDFIIGQNSDAIGQGNTSGAMLVPLDILGVSRTVTIDLGAYQHIDFD